jgi:hypothetical protein
MDIYQQRRLISAFAYIDRLLAESLDILTNPEARSRFTHYAADASPEQRQMIKAQLHRAREAMNRIMLESSIPFPAPICGTLWAMHSNVVMSLISIDESGYESSITAPVRVELEVLEKLVKGEMPPKQP